MCNINKKSEKKSVTIYKVVHKIPNGKGGFDYYSLFAGTPVKIGKAVKQTKATLNTAYVIGIGEDVNEYINGFHQYNKLIVGKITGFKFKKTAKELHRGVSCYSKCITILKMVITGDIYEGTAKGISWSIEKWEDPTYAGTIIKSIEEIL